MTCKKCGSWRMSGPRYHKAIGLVEEALVYRCDLCGAEERKPVIESVDSIRALQEALRGVSRARS